MNDQQLLTLIEQRGALAVARLCREGLAAALQDGLDLSNWHVKSSAGALLFYQVATAPDAPHVPLRAGMGVGAPAAIVTDGPRVLVVNDVPGPQWAAFERDVTAGVLGEPGITTTMLYADGTRRRLRAAVS